LTTEKPDKAMRGREEERSAGEVKADEEGPEEAMRRGND